MNTDEHGLEIETPIHFRIRVHPYYCPGKSCFLAQIFAAKERKEHKEKLFVPCLSGSLTMWPSAECDRPRSQQYRKEGGAAVPEDGRTPEIVKQPDKHGSFSAFFAFCCGHCLWLRRQPRYEIRGFSFGVRVESSRFRTPSPAESKVVTPQATSLHSKTWRLLERARPRASVLDCGDGAKRSRRFRQCRTPF